MNLLYRKRKNW